MDPITPELRITELLMNHPELREVLHQHGAFCDECIAMNYDTVQHAAMMHGLDLNSLIAELQTAQKS